MKNQTGIKDFLWFSIIAVTILAFSSIPYWTARSVETDRLLFRGIYFDEADYSVHISMMQAGRMGDWAYQMRFTSEEHQPAFLRMFYIILGHISKWVNLDVETTFHVARWIFGMIALYSIYQLCKRIFPDQSRARAAFLLSVLGAGAGWLQLILGAPLKPISPIDFWLIDAYVFFSISLFPSFSFTLAVMTTTLNLYLDYLNSGKWVNIMLISLLAVISQTTNPIAFAVIDITFAGVTCFCWWKNGKINPKQFYALGVIGIAQIPLLAYNFLILNGDPIWSQFTSQNQTLSPPPIFYFRGFFPFWALAIYGAILAFRQRYSNMVAVASWAIFGFTLAYVPVLIQRRFVLGITIPLGILSIYGLSHGIKSVAGKFPGLLKREGLVYFACILLASISSIYLILGLSLYMQTRPADKFYPRDLEIALVWLDQNAAPNDFVLGDIKTGQLVAQRTRLKTYVGHPMETLFFDDKIASAEAFYTGNAANDWIQKTPIRWVFFGQYEKEIAPTFPTEIGLQLVYQNKAVQIYEVKR